MWLLSMHIECAVSIAVECLWHCILCASGLRRMWFIDCWCVYFRQYTKFRILKSCTPRPTMANPLLTTARHLRLKLTQCSTLWLFDIMQPTLTQLCNVTLHCGHYIMVNHTIFRAAINHCCYFYTHDTAQWQLWLSNNWGEPERAPH